MALQVQQQECISLASVEIRTATCTTEVHQDGITVIAVESALWIRESANIVQLGATGLNLQTHGPISMDTASIQDKMHTGTELPECLPHPTSKKKCWLISGAVAFVFAVIFAVVIWKVLSNQQQTFSRRFISKCLEYKKDNNESYCQQIFHVFEKAYIGKPMCNVTMEDYDDLMAMVPFDHPCHQTMLWSKTNELVHKYTAKDEDKKDCFTLEDTLLGYILNDERWCGKKGSNETFINGCPGIDDCANSAVRSFWDSASAEFAEYACGNVTVMLSGSEEKPFNPFSTFARVEIKRLKHPFVKKLNVILVTGNKNVSNCAADNLKIDLRKALDSNILYSCNEVPESRIRECSSSSSDNTDVGCVACLLKPNE